MKLADLFDTKLTESPEILDEDLATAAKALMLGTALAGAPTNVASAKSPDLGYVPLPPKSITMKHDTSYSDKAVSAMNDKVSQLMKPKIENLLGADAPKYDKKITQQVKKAGQSDKQVSAKYVRPVSAGAFYKIGSPYKIKDKIYTPKYDPTYNKVGIASWYGPGFHGKQTANGDIFDENSMQAAHPTLPLPCIATVTDVTTGKKIKVTITDRGPYHDNRIIDLSKKAAETLGYKNNGLAKVRVEYDKSATEQMLKQRGLYDQFLEVNNLKPIKVAEK